MKKILSETNGNCRRWMIVAAIFIVISVLEGFFLLYFHYFNIDFTEVHREHLEFDWESTSAWRSTRSESKSKVIYSPEEIFHVDFSDYDLKKYTYIISYGYELLDVSCSLSEMKNSNGLYFVPKMIFKSERKDMIYIYQIPKTELDYDMHQTSRNVFFKNR